MTSKEIRAKISGLLMEQRKIALAHGGFTAESRQKFDKIQKDVEQLEADVQRTEAFEQRDAAGREFRRSPRPGTGTGAEFSGDEQRSRVSRAFQQYAMRGSIHAVDAEYRDLLTTSDATGGALLPQMFSGILVDARKFYGPIADKVMQKVTDNKGVPMKISYSNDTGNGLTLLGTEGSSSPAETDPAFVSALLGVDTVTGGLVKVSFQELEDSSFDLDAFIRSHFAVRYARGLEKVITLGTDSAGTALPNQPTGGLRGAATVGVTTATIADGIGWQALTQLFSSVDPAYSTPASSFVMSAATRAYLLGQVDGFGRPYWTPDPSADGPFNKLLGFDVVINQSMDSPTAGVFAANSLPILFGDLSRAYMLRTDGQPSILRLNERYADTLEVGFFLWSRVGGLSLAQSGAPTPMNSLKIAAS
ncbi:MAG: phage major capsid protein [Acidobacteriaceae bacterium]